MLKNYVKIAFRNLIKYKIYSFINIFGLAIGIACCILILLFVKNEWSYDNFHSKADNIYRISLLEDYAEDQKFFNSVTPLPLGSTLKEAFPEVTSFVRIAVQSNIIQRNEKSFSERYHLVDKSFFSVFDFDLISGKKDEVFKEPNSVVITKSAAEKYFSSGNPSGQILSIKLNETFQDFKITGVAKDVPANSSIQFQFLIPFDKAKDIYPERAFTAWYNVVCETYILTRAGSTPAQLEAKVPQLVKTLMGEKYKEGTYNLKFQPLKDIHLDTSYPEGFESISNPVYSYILVIIGALVLIIASINFITLSIGRSASRANEVGIRKVIGAEKNHLIRQFWGESLLLVLLSAVLAVVLAEILLPSFNNLSNKNLSLHYDPATIAGLAGMVLIIGLAAGLYPALILSAFKPVEVLKGKVKIKSRTRLRRGLITGQYVMSVVLLTSTFIISDQLEYIKNKNLGYNKEQIIVIPSGLKGMETINAAELLRNELSSNNKISNVTAAAVPFNSSWNFIGFGTLGGEYHKFFINMVDYDFLKTFKITLTAGRDFSGEFPNDVNEAVIVNESFVKQFKIDLPLTGKMPGSFTNNKIIGVVKDFHFESLHSEIKPAALVINPNNIFRSANDIGINNDPKIYVKIKTADLLSAIKSVKAAWEKVVPQVPFENTFLDEDLNKRYQSEERLSTIVTTSCLFAVLITCLGLFGLTILITIQKAKEIGIRKVLGASVTSILGMLSKEFALLILLANVIAWPAAYYAMNMWLQDFTYRTSITYSSFILSGMIILIISMATIAGLVYKASVENPVKSIKYE